jgi:hypothetical protein
MLEHSNIGVVERVNRIGANTSFRLLFALIAPDLLGS